MKIFERKNVDLVRVDIRPSDRRKGNQSVLVQDSDIISVYDFLKGLGIMISEHRRMSDKSVTVQVREYTGSKSGRSKNFTIYGHDPLDVKEFFENKIKQQHEGN